MYRDEPIGRRLRPEESAVTETQTGFLGSGWSARTELSEPVWPDEKRRSGGRVKTMVLAVAAVAVVLGGTVAGVQVMSAAGSSENCPAGSCLAEASEQPELYSTGDGQADPTERPAPSDEPEKAGKEKTGPAPAPTPSATPSRAGRTSTARPTPTPEATRTAQRGGPARRTGAPVPVPEPEPEPSPTGEALITGTRTQDPAPSPAVTQPPTTQPTQPPTTQPSSPEILATPAAGGAALRVGFGIVSKRGETYTAKLVVTANAKLTGLTLSLPVGGEVASVTGADWKQDGDTLVLETVRDLEAGKDLVLTFTAYGRAEVPRSCESTQAECAVS
ncbi:hypothetical protein [Streptosporangium sp. NPDC087985]|uniref:hypothetical protein n=1 Tax=Streptosporangium sp. NPDC087985 TaxID=3366196 RepID=UPI003823E477